MTYFGQTRQFHSKKCTKYLWLVYWYCGAVYKLQNDTEVCCNKLQCQEEIMGPWPSNTCLYHHFTFFNNNGPGDSTSFLPDPLMGCWGKWRLTLTVPDLHPYTGPLDLLSRQRLYERREGQQSDSLGKRKWGMLSDFHVLSPVALPSLKGGTGSGMLPRELQVTIPLELVSNCTKP